MDLDKIALEGAFEGNDRLDEEWIGVFEIHVHDSHHPNTHELGLEQPTKLLEVVRVYGCGYELGLFGATHGRWLNIFKGGKVFPGCRQRNVIMNQWAMQNYLFSHLSSAAYIGRCRQLLGSTQCIEHGRPSGLVGRQRGSSWIPASCPR